MEPARIGAQAVSAGQLRIGAFNLVSSELVFIGGVAEALRGRAEFHFFQARRDTLALARQLGLATVTPSGAPEADPGLAEHELLAACGPHELHWAHDPAALLEQARALAPRIAGFIDACRLDAALIWNGAPLLRALAAAIARRRGLATVFVENGYLPGTMQIDPAGVNYHASFTPRIRAADYADFDGDETRLDAALARLRDGSRPADAMPLRTPKAPAGARLRRELLRLGSAEAWRWTRAPRGAAALRRLPEGCAPFVLLPLQVVHDSQLSVHSPLVGHDQQTLVMRLYLAIKRVLPGYRLVVKLHPKERRHLKLGYLGLQAALPDTIWLDAQPMREVLPVCALVVTINSTAGVEALAFDKPVLTLGRNFYTVPELVQPARALDTLEDDLLAALQTPRDARQRRRFLAYLQQRVLAPASNTDLSAGNLARAAECLLRCAQRNSLG